MSDSLRDALEDMVAKAARRAVERREQGRGQVPARVDIEAIRGLLAAHPVEPAPTCICGTPGLTYAGPERDCPIHGEPAGVSDKAVAVASAAYLASRYPDASVNANRVRPKPHAFAVRAALEAAQPFMGATPANEAPLRKLAEWLVQLDDPGNEERRSTNLTQIVTRAAAAIVAAEEEPAAEHFVTVEFDGPGGTALVGFICKAAPDAPCHMVCARECESCDHDRTQQVSYCNPGEFIGNGGEGPISQAGKQQEMTFPVDLAWNGDTYTWTIRGKAAQPSREGTLPVASRERVAEVLRSHAIGTQGDLTACRCGWYPDGNSLSWHHFHAEHVADALLAAGVFREVEPTCTAEHPRRSGHCVFVAGHHDRAVESWTPHGDRFGWTWNDNPPADES